ncbi:MAG TPA: recombinase RecT [Syntrophobacter fumaroxidans]|nr:recombinase RecT [Syntrophobacter fumaroxidans]
MSEKQPESSKAAATREPTYSERFTAMVVREFGAQMGGAMELTPQQKRLAQHLFIKIDVALSTYEAKRLDANQNNKLPFVWQNVNVNKLAIDAMHRIELGLDALIPNSIHPIPYFNGRLKKYDLDLRIGYVGKDYYRREVAVEKPLDIIYELVYSKDKFKALKRAANNPTESYEFEIVNPFDRGEIVGGFGYIMYEDSRKNRLIIVTAKDFERSEKLAGSKDFWTKNPAEMRYKTLVHRVTDKLIVDPEKVGRAYAEVETAEAEAAFRRQEAEVEEEISRNANKGEVIDVDPEPAAEQPAPVNGGPSPQAAQNAQPRQAPGWQPDF